MKQFIFGGVVETHPNSQHRTFHMKHQLVEKNKWFPFQYLGTELADEKVLLPCSKITGHALHKIPGVKDVTLRPFEVGITKAEAYTWDELYPSIKLAIAKYLPATY